MEITLPCGIYDRENDRVVKQVTLKALTGDARFKMGHKKYQESPTQLSEFVVRQSVERVGERPATEAMIARMTSADIDYILIQSRIFSIGDEVRQTFTCLACQAKNDMDIALSEIEVLRVENPEIQDQDLVFTLSHDADEDDPTDVSFVGVFRYPTAMDMRAVVKLGRQNLTEAEMTTWWRCCKSWNGEDFTNSKPPPKKIFKDLPIATNNHLSQMFQDAMVGVDGDGKVSCHKCDRVAPYTVDVISYFLSTAGAETQRQGRR